MKDTTKPCDFNHLLLYSKGWYKVTNFVDDIRAILAHRCGLQKEYLRDSDLWSLIMHAAGDYLSQRDINDVIMCMFSTSWVDEPGTDNGMFCEWQGKTNWVRPAKLLVSKLQQVEVVNKLHLGEPNPKILPLCDENALKRYKKMQKENAKKYDQSP